MPGDSAHGIRSFFNGRCHAAPMSEIARLAPASPQAAVGSLQGGRCRGSLSERTPNAHDALGARVDGFRLAICDATHGASRFHAGADIEFAACLRPAATRRQERSLHRTHAVSPQEPKTPWLRLRQRGALCLTSPSSVSTASEFGRGVRGANHRVLSAIRSRAGASGTEVKSMWQPILLKRGPRKAVSTSD
jgi:hypothetical protein